MTIINTLKQQTSMGCPADGLRLYLYRLLPYLITILLIVFPTLSVLAAQTSVDSTPQSNKQSSVTKIVFCNDGHTNPYHVEWLAGFEAALTAYNERFGGIEGYWCSSSNLEDQLKQIEKEIDKGVDIFFVNSISVDAMKPLVRKAQAKGTIWIAVHNYMDIADYNFLLGDVENGYHQGMALATYFNGKAKVGIMGGIRGMASGEDRVQGILNAFKLYPEIEVFAREPANWNTAKALNIANEWLVKYPDIDAISAVTDTYIYPTMQIAEYLDRQDILYFGYDGDKAILDIMKQDGVVKADILLGSRREGWNFMQMAYKIINNIPVEKVYNFHTPLVLSEATYKRCLANGFPTDIEVYSVEKALEVSANGAIEFGPDSVAIKE